MAGSRSLESRQRSRIQRRPGREPTRLRRRGLHDQVVDELGLRIVREEFGDEGLLPTEPELGAELGVSRNALREAIKVLVGKGLLEVRTKTGMRVRPKSEWNLLDRAVLDWHASSRLRVRHAFDVVEFRLIVEPRASYLAAKRATGAERKAIPPTDITFHSLLHRASHNALLVYLGRLIGSLMSTQVKLTTRDIEFFKKGLPYHRKLAEAIAGRDAANAQAISTALVQMPYDYLAERMRVKPALRL
jgi:GntR family galactonate operon transcriptional repressor